MKKLNKKGFTIVELVIVIAVIGILSAVLIPTFSNLTEKANENAALQAATNEYKNWQIDYVETGTSLEGYYFVAKQNNADYYFQVVKGVLELKGKTAPTGNATEHFADKWDENVKVYTYAAQ